jgi:hypothetical protein
MPAAAQLERPGMERPGMGRAAMKLGAVVQANADPAFFPRSVVRMNAYQ